MIHYKEGWYFERGVKGGAVRIIKGEKIGNEIVGNVSIIIDSDSWVSIIASVSARGETAEQFHNAMSFHNDV